MHSSCSFIKLDLSSSIRITPRVEILSEYAPHYLTPLSLVKGGGNSSFRL